MRKRDRHGKPFTGTVIPLQTLLAERPWEVDWFNALRWFEAKNPQAPRLGRAMRARDEVLRVSQPPALHFAPAALARYEPNVHGRPQLAQLGFGLFGPNGPLPLHLTEYVHNAVNIDKDAGLQAFFDIFQHRAALLFYRAWSSAQAAASLDRPGDDVFSRYIGCLTGYGEVDRQVDQRKPDSVPALARHYMAGHLVRLTRNPEGLSATLSHFFGAIFRIEEWVMNWLELSPEDRSTLGGYSDASRLGVGAVCGAAVPDRLHRFRLHAGPLGRATYERLLPGGDWHTLLRDWVRNYCGFELAWDMRLILRADQVPAAQLGGTSRLGWTSWLGGELQGQDRGDLILDVEALAQASG